MIRKIKEEIRIDQEFYRSFGLYIYKKEKIGYFALSNTFLPFKNYL